MKTTIENAVKALVLRLTDKDGKTIIATAPEALNLTQAALNLAHVEAVMVQTELVRHNLET
jgi:hypothetical protein